MRTAENAYMSVEQVAGLLGLHAETIRRFVRERRIPAFKVGRSWRFSRPVIEAWVREHGNEVVPLRVLAVDDEPDIAEVIRLTLAQAGFVVDTARDAAQAVGLIRAETYELVLLDLRLPQGSGVDIIRELRSQSEETPVVIITGYPDSDLMHQAMAYSPLVVLAKPVDPLLLRKTVENAIRGSGSRRTPRTHPSAGAMAVRRVSAPC